MKLFLVRRLPLVGLVTGMMLIGAGSAHATTITGFTNLAAWQAAAGLPVALEDFADATLVPGLTIEFGTNSPAGFIGGGTYNDLAVTQFNDAKNPKFDFAPGTTAFGADWDLSPGGPGAGIVLAVHVVGGGASFLSGGGFAGTFSGFFGIVSDTAFDQIRFDSPGTGQEQFAMDNARFRTSGDGAAVAEPTSLLLLGTGGLGLLAKMRRRKNEKPTSV